MIEENSRTNGEFYVGGIWLKKNKRWKKICSWYGR